MTQQNDNTEIERNLENETDASDAEISTVNDADAEVLQNKLQEAQQQLLESQDKLIRMQAEMENLLKRTKRDVSSAHKYAIEKFALEMLQVKDSLELGLSADKIDVDKLREGTELTLKMLASVLEKFDIAVVDPLGEPFDPNLHEAMTMQPSSEYAPNTVMNVVQKGYTLHDRLLRPAMVIVSKADE